MPIRPATNDDVPEITAMIRELAVYERMQDEAVANEEGIAIALFGDGHHAWCNVAEEGGEIVGFALWILNYSTFQGAPGLYLEDLYVREEFRGRGIGLALMKELARLCVERGYQRFQWSVLNWNEPSIAFYRSIGAVAMDEWTVYRLSGETLNEFTR